MKKLIPALLISGMISSVFVSCGPSAEEKAAAEKMRQDSIQSVMDKMAADSIAAVQAIEQARMDSMATAQADSIAKAEAAAKTTAVKPKPKPKPKPVVADPKVTGQPKVGQKKPGAK